VQSIDAPGTGVERPRFLWRHAGEPRGHSRIRYLARRTPIRGGEDDVIPIATDIRGEVGISWERDEHREIRQVAGDFAAMDGDRFPAREGRRRRAWKPAWAFW